MDEGTTLVIEPEQIDEMVDAAIAGFMPEPDLPCQAAPHAAIRAARDDGDIELAAALVFVHAARGAGPESLHEAPGAPVRNRIERTYRRRGDGS